MGDPAGTTPDFETLYRQIQALPEGVTGEILDPGVLHTKGRPGKAHRRAHLQAPDALRGRNANLGGSGWWIEVEVELRLGAWLMVPDLCGWRVERVPELPDENPLTIVPDWCCEVLSPGSTGRSDRLTKLPRYLDAGVAHVWLIDPALRVVEVYVAREGSPARIAAGGDADVLALPPFEGEFALAPWWLPDAEQAEWRSRRRRCPFGARLKGLRMGQTCRWASAVRPMSGVQRAGHAAVERGSACRPCGR